MTYLTTFYVNLISAAGQVKITKFSLETRGQGVFLQC